MLREDIEKRTHGLSAPALLRHLLVEALPGKAIVTASLRMRSIVVLKMISEIDPATPITFCHAGHLFPESIAYRDRIVSALGLCDVRALHGAEAAVPTGDRDRYEVIWAECENCDGRVYQIVHVNETLLPFDCWISAVYHELRPAEGRHRVEDDGRLIRVDPLYGWSRDDIRAFMTVHGLPAHPRVDRPRPPPPADQPDAASVSCHF